MQVISEEKAQELIDEAMKSGSLKQRNVIGIITGLMGSGKTTLLHHLFGVAPPNLYTSTNVTERSFRGLLHHILHLSTGAWKRLSYKDIRKLLSPLIQAGMKECDVDSLATRLMHSIGVETRKSMSLPDSSVTAENFSSQNKAPFTAPTSLPNKESLSCREMVPLVTTATPSNIPSDFVLELVHMIDTGGQPELMEVMPSLIHNTNLAMVLVDLRYGLHEHPPVDHHEKGVRYKRPFQSHYTGREIILKLTSTLHSKKLEDESFRLFIVATHRDCVKRKVEAQIKTLNHELSNLLLPAFEKQLILFQPPDGIAFVLNLKNPDKNDKDMLELIRTKVGEPGLGSTFNTPTSFFVFEQDLLKFAEDANRYILTLNECRLVGARLKMSNEMVEAALLLFHRQNTFLYFQQILPNHVFIDPHVPLDIINGIVHFSYKVNAGMFKGFPAKFVTLLKECIVTKEMLSYDHISPHFEKGIYEVQDALKLFCHTFTFAPLEPRIEGVPFDGNNKEYLMMCLKPAVPDKQLHQYVPKLSDTVPLVMNFSSGCVPLGCFGSTISCLLSKYGWEVIRKQGFPKCLAHNIASLHDPDLIVDITLVDFTQHIEISISTSISQRPSPADICTHVRRKVFGAVQKVFRVMKLSQDQIKISPAFICKCTNVSHYAIFRKENLLRCSESTIYNANPRQLLWMGEDLCSKPDLPELLRLEIPEKVGADYQKFGILLLNDEVGDRVASIEANCFHNTEAIVRNILRQWLRSQPTPVTWKNLIDILTSCNLTTLAQDIKTSCRAL